MATLNIGDIAPGFELKNQNGKTTRLSDFTGKKNVVLFFYPKDNSPGCTAEACTFRDHYEDFASADTEVIGISSDSELSHQRFAGQHKLNFTLLSDPGGIVRKKYNADGILGLIPGRITYIIDKNGKIAGDFSSQLQPKKHVFQALDVLKGMVESP